MKKINVQISLDRAMDELSILQIKYQQVKDAKLKELIAGQIRDMESRIVKAIGFKTYQKVIGSKEFAELYDKNFAVFEGVDLSKSDPHGYVISGYKLDQLNVKRGAAKRNLCALFCGGESEEIKIKSDGSQI